MRRAKGPFFIFFFFLRGFASSAERNALIKIAKRPRRGRDLSSRRRRADSRTRARLNHHRHLRTSSGPDIIVDVLVDIISLRHE